MFEQADFLRLQPICILIFFNYKAFQRPLQENSNVLEFFNLIPLQVCRMCFRSLQKEGIPSNSLVATTKQKHT